MNRKASLVSLHNALNISKDSYEQNCFENLEDQLEGFVFTQYFFELMVETWRRSLETLNKGNSVRLEIIFKGQLEMKGNSIKPADKEVWEDFKDRLTAQAMPILDGLGRFYESIAGKMSNIRGNLPNLERNTRFEKNRDASSRSPQIQLNELSEELKKNRRSQLSDLKKLIDQSNSIVQEPITEEKEDQGNGRGELDVKVYPFGGEKKQPKTTSELIQGRRQNLNELKGILDQASKVVKETPTDNLEFTPNKNESIFDDKDDSRLYLTKKLDENLFESATKKSKEPTVPLISQPVRSSAEGFFGGNNTGTFDARGSVENRENQSPSQNSNLFFNRISQPEKFQIDQSVAGERSPSRIQVSPEKQDDTVNLVSNDSAGHQYSDAKDSPDKKIAALRASLQARDLGMTRQIFEEIADLKNMFLSFMEHGGGMQPNVSDFSVNDCSPIKEVEKKKQSEFMNTDVKNVNAHPGPFGNTAFTPSLTPMKPPPSPEKLQGSATKKLDRVMSMLQNLLKCHQQELDVLAKVVGTSPEDIMERSRIEEVYEKNKAAREAARQELLNLKKAEEKQISEQFEKEQKEKKSIEDATDNLMKNQDISERMKSRETVYNFVLMYQVLCKLLQGMTQSQMCSLKFVSKMKTSLIGEAQSKFVKKVKKLTSSIEEQYKQIKLTENRRGRLFVTQVDPTGILLDPELRTILLADLELSNKQFRYFDKQITDLSNLVFGLQSSKVPSSDRARKIAN